MMQSSAGFRYLSACLSDSETQVSTRKVAGASRLRSALQSLVLGDLRSSVHFTTPKEQMPSTEIQLVLNWEVIC